MIKKIIKLNLDDLIFLCSLLAGTFLVIHLVTAAILLFAGVQSSLQLSGVILPCISDLFLIIYAIVHTLHTFQDTLRHSITRRRALAGLLGLFLFQAAVSLALTALLTWLEQLFSPALWTALSGASGYELGVGGQVVGISGSNDAFLLFIERIAFPWWVTLLVPLVCTLLGLIMGALIQRFGRTAGWILWAVWMAVMIFQSHIPWAQLTAAPGLIPACTAVLAALTAWSLWSLLHAVIKR